METQIIITGGHPDNGQWSYPSKIGSKNVTVYDMYGLRTFLPQMNNARYSHGCGYYRNDVDQMVSMRHFEI